MKTRREFTCGCGAVFLASRSDAKHCPGCHARRRAAWQAANTDRRRTLRRQLRERLFSGYGGKCVCCGEDRFEFLALDHVNGGGRRDRMKRSTDQIARRAIKDGFPDTYRVLCHNCNQAIGWYGQCPHLQHITWRRTA